MIPCDHNKSTVFFPFIGYRLCRLLYGYLVAKGIGEDCYGHVHYYFCYTSVVKEKANVISRFISLSCCW